VNATQSKSSTHRKERTGAESGLLLCPENRVLCRLGDSEFDDGLGWNLDLLLRLGIEAGASLPLLLTSLPKPGKTNPPVFLVSLYASALSGIRATVVARGKE